MQEVSPVEMTEQWLDERWAEACEEMRKYDEECERVNNRIMRAIENQIGKGFAKDLKEYIGEGEVRGMWRLTREQPPTKYFQMETDFGCIVGAWGRQWSTGIEGDSFAGYLWVQLKTGLWLEMDFSC